MILTSTPQARPGAAEVIPAGERANILLVDDEPRNLLVLEATLESLGQNLVVAHSGREALRRLLEEDFAVILMDVHMPDMDGLETAQIIRLRQRCQHVPIIFLTAYGQDDEQTFRGYSQGAVDFLFKPIIPEVLRSKVAVFVELFRRTEMIKRQAELLRETQRREHERQLAEEKRRWEEERMREKIRVARQIQQALFPAAAPAVPGLDVFGASFPADDTGGDYFDYVPLAPDQLGVVVGDVCGHGLGPAMLMAATRAYVRSLAPSRGVGEVLGLVNRALAADVSEGRFVTLCLVALAPAGGGLVYANAGHSPAYVIDARGEVQGVLKATGPPLGIDADAEFTEGRLAPLAPGDLLLLLTDGVVETPNADGTFFGTERAVALARGRRHESARVVVDALCQAVRDHAGPRGHDDDITALVVKRPAG